jgi:hypothetical protein
VEFTDYASTPYGKPRRTLGRHSYVAYFPEPIPRAIELPAPTIRLLADAEASLGRLAGVGQLMPNPHLLIRPYLLREALSSARIEGTQASLADVFEVQASGEPPNADVEEVLNYIDALEWGLGQLGKLPLGVRLIRNMHRRLLSGVRGRERTPGKFRTTQNWVGESGSTVETALFVPPPPAELPALLAEVPLLVQNAILHYQFETLHPFLDGNGRIGSLLSVFLLVEHGRLPCSCLRDHVQQGDRLGRPRVRNADHLLTRGRGQLGRYAADGPETPPSAGEGWGARGGKPRATRPASLSRAGVDGSGDGRRNRFGQGRGVSVGRRAQAIKQMAGRPPSSRLAGRGTT